MLFILNGKVFDIVEFGDYPQSKKRSGVTVNENIFFMTGNNTYYAGSDCNYYAKVDSDYFKVEPIKWRVLTNDYNGKRLLL